MKKILLFFILALLVFTEIQAQRRNGLIRRRSNSAGSIVASFGPAYCFGDPKDSPFGNSFVNGTNADFSLGFRQRFANNLGYKATMVYGNYVGTESPLNRNLDFNSNVLQFSVRGEYGYEFGFGRFRRDKPNFVYGFIGAGIMSSKISHNLVSYPGVDIKSNVLTEVTPYGFGYQYDFNNNFMLGAEVGWQFPLSDYIDGLHPISGSSKSNDILFGVSVTLAYRIF